MSNRVIVEEEVIRVITIAEQGPPGTGLPVGGTTGQVIRKRTGANYDYEYDTLAKADVGLSSVDNTADVDKPVSMAQQSALDAKLDDSQLDTDVTLTANGDSRIPTQKAVRSFTNAGLATKEPVVAAGSAAQYWRGDKTWQTLDKSAVGLGNVPNVDATDRTNHTGTQLAVTISDFATAADARIAAQKGVASGLATLGADSKIPSSQLPALAISNTFVVASQAAMLALTAGEGDVAVRTDLSETFILTTSDPTQLANWQQILTPASPVQTVNGQTGNVSITAAGLGALVAGNNLSDLTSAATARTNLGVAIGTNVQAYDATLAALAAFNSNGILTQTAADTFVSRSIVAGSGKLTVTNGSGVGGNPAIDLGSVASTDLSNSANISLLNATQIYTGMHTFAAGALADKGSQVFNVKAAGFGALGDGKIYYDGAISSGSASLVCSSGTFAVTDIGKTITIGGAGASGALLTTTILGFISTSNVILATTASTTVSGKLVMAGSLDDAAIQAAIDAANAAGGGDVILPPGTYFLSNRLNFNNRSNITFRAAGRHAARLAVREDFFTGAHFGFSYMLHNDVGSTSSDVTIDGIHFWGGYSHYTAPPSSIVGGIVPTKRWLVQNNVFEDFNYFVIGLGAETLYTRITNNFFTGLGRGADTIGNGGATYLDVSYNTWDAGMNANAFDSTGGSYYNFHHNTILSNSVYLEAIVHADVHHNTILSGGGLNASSDAGYDPASITNSYDIKFRDNIVKNGGSIGYSIAGHATKTSTLGGQIQITGNMVDSPLDYGILIQGYADATLWAPGNIVAGNIVNNANANNATTFNTGYGVINSSGINILQGHDIVVANNVINDTRATPRQRYGIQIGQIFAPDANNQPDRVTVIGNRVYGYVTAPVNRVSSTYTPNYVEVSDNISLPGNIVLPTGTLSVGTTAATKPVNLKSNSSEDLIQIKNYAGVDKWHVSTTGGTDLSIIETGVATRLTLAAGGGATLSGLLTAGSLSAGLASLTSLSVDGHSSTAVPATVEGSQTNNDVLAVKNNAGTTKWLVTLGSSGTDLDFTESGVANNRLHLKAGGNVGIGRSNPSTALDVNGTVTATLFAGSGASLTSIPESAVTNLVTDLAAKAPLASPTFTGTVTVPTPVGATDAANKAYVDAIATGLDVKASVRVVAASNITLSGTQTVDGVAVVAGDRVLVTGQSSAATNGIYVVAAGSWARATDADASTEVTGGMFTFVEEGGTYAGNGFVLTTANPITLGTTALVFTQFSGAGEITAGYGLSKSGNILSLLTTLTSATTIDGSGSTSIPLTIKGSASFNDLLKFKNNAGTDKWIFGLTSGNDINLTEAGVANNRLYIAAGGNIGIGLTGPSAKLHLAAGSTTAGSSPLKFVSGSLMSAAEAGAVEFNADSWYGTITTGAARKTFAMLEKAQTWTAAQTFNAGALLDKGSQVFNVKAYGAVGDGVTDDSAAIQAAANAMSGGGILFFPQGTYLVNSFIQVKYSGTVIMGAGLGSSIVKANFTDLSHGVFLFYNTNLIPVNSICVKDLSVNLNSKTTPAVFVAATDTANITHNYLFENFEVYSRSPDSGGSSGAFVFKSGYSGLAGTIEHVTFRHVIVRDGIATDSSHKGGQSMRFLANGMNHIRFEDCYFYNVYGHTMEMSSTSVRSNSDWKLVNCKFEKTIQNFFAETLADFFENRNGFNGFEVDGCYFDQGAAVLTTGADVYALAIYNTKSLEIHDSYFYKCRAVIAPGHSSPVGNEDFIVDFHDNVIDQCYSFGDMDGNYASNYHDNIFYRIVTGPIFFCYGQNYPTSYKDNIFYECLTDPDTSHEYTQSIFLMEWGGNVVEGNTIYDNNPLTKCKYAFFELPGNSPTFVNVYSDNHIMGTGPSTQTFYLDSSVQHVIQGNTGVKETIIQNSATVRTAGTSALSSQDVVARNFRFNGLPTTNIESFGGPLSLAGATSGTTLVVAGVVATGTLTLPSATDTLVGKATTDTFTNKTYDTAGTGNALFIDGVPATANTGTGSVVRATSPSLVTPVLGTPASATLTNATGLPLTTGVTGTLPVANGGTGVTSSTGSGSNVLSGSPTFTGTITAAALTLGGSLTITGNILWASSFGAITVDSSNLDIYGVNNVYLSPSGVDGTKVVMSDGTVRVGGPGRTSATLNLAAGGINIVLDTAIGTKIGTSTGQKLGLWNATPIVQPTTAIAAATLVGGGGAALTDSDTFDGYTLKQIVKALRNIGALA